MYYNMKQHDSEHEKLGKSLGTGLIAHMFTSMMSQDIFAKF